jgi:hypothetical protein
MRNSQKIRAIFLQIFVLTTFCFASISAKASFIDFGFTAGVSIPSDNVSQYFDDFEFRTASADTSFADFGNFLTDNPSTFGYNFGIKARIELSEKFYLIPGISYFRFNKAQYASATPYESKPDTFKTDIESTTSIVPISLGIQGFLFKSLIGIYGIAEVTYNYTSNSVLEKNIENLKERKFSETASRLGIGIGPGIQADLAIVDVGFEVKFNIMNIIGKSGNEPSKNYVNFAFNVFF